MKKVVFLAIVLCFVLGFSPATMAQGAHTVHVEDGFGPVDGVNIDIYVKTGAGANDWSHHIHSTDLNGDAICDDLEPNANAVFWYAILDAAEYPVVPLEDWIQEADYPDLEISWLIE